MCESGTVERGGIDKPYGSGCGKGEQQLFVGAVK